jgi:hypothetical protein
VRGCFSIPINPAERAEYLDEVKASREQEEPKRKP